MSQLEEISKILMKPGHFWGVPFEEVERLVPPLAALKGREQRADYHPEGDAYTHTLLVIDRIHACRRPVRLAWMAMAHDFGKAVTVQEKPGTHYNHEALGVPIVQEFFRRVKTPKSWEEAAVAITRDHLNIHRFMKLKPVKKVRLMMRIWRWVDEAGIICEADVQGRGPSFQHAFYAPRAAIQHAYFTLSEYDMHPRSFSNESERQSFEREAATLMQMAFHDLH